MRPVSSYSGRTNYARLGAQFAIFACGSRATVARLCLAATISVHEWQSTDDTPHGATAARAVSTCGACSDWPFFVRQKKIGREGISRYADICYLWRLCNAPPH